MWVVEWCEVLFVVEYVFECCVEVYGDGGVGGDDEFVLFGVGDDGDVDCFDL